jgi:hypothetical protein
VAGDAKVAATAVGDGPVKLREPMAIDLRCLALCFTDGIRCGDEEFVSAIYAGLDLGKGSLREQAEAARDLVNRLVDKVVGSYVDVAKLIAQQLVRWGEPPPLGVLIRLAAQGGIHGVELPALVDAVLRTAFGESASAP